MMKDEVMKTCFLSTPALNFWSRPKPRAQSIGQGQDQPTGKATKFGINAKDTI